MSWLQQAKSKRTKEASLETLVVTVTKMKSMFLSTVIQEIGKKEVFHPEAESQELTEKFHQTNLRTFLKMSIRLSKKSSLSKHLI